LLEFNSCQIDDKEGGLRGEISKVGVFA